MKKSLIKKSKVEYNNIDDLMRGYLSYRRRLLKINDNKVFGDLKLSIGDKYVLDILYYKIENE